VVLLEPKVFGDDRGFFMETFNQRVFRELTGIASALRAGQPLAIRGRRAARAALPDRRQPQGKLVRVVSGSVFDVAVDLRRSSSSFGQWYGALN
jgi:dTDP-4-dehydrorhamnose 3,5-epimerase